MAMRKFELEDVETVQAETDQDYPIATKSLADVCERIYEQYPLVDRTELAVVVRGFFRVLRRKLLNGETISFASFVTNFHLGISKKISIRSTGEPNESVDQIRVRLRTPRRMREEYAKRR